MVDTPTQQPAAVQPPTAGPAAPPADDLAARADRWSGQVVTLLNQEGQAPEAAALNAERQRKAPEKPMVIVAGEDKRGKSSLVNALIGRPGFLPTGVEVVTATPIVVFKAKADQGFVIYYEDNEHHAVDVDEARSLTTVLGNPDNEHSVRTVQLGVDCPLLDHMSLVDTPGVGGLESGHSNLTIQRLNTADALVFVLEAGAQLRGPELIFLERAAARIQRVIFVLTKVDLYRGWQQVMADNQRILTERSPRLAECPMVPVSSALAARAAKLEPAGAEAIRRESGVTELERLLIEQVGGRSGKIRVGNLLQAGMTPLSALERGAVGRLEAITSPEETEQTLIAERTRLSEMTQERAEWPQTLQVELRRLGLDRTEELARGILEIRGRYDDRLKEVKLADHKTLPGELVADLTALVAKVNEWTEDRLVTLLVQLVGTIDDQANLTGSLRQITDAAFAEEMASVEMGEHGLDTMEKVGLVQSYSMGHMMGSMIGIGGAALLGPVGLVIGFALGGAMAFQRFKASKQGNFSREFLSWESEQIQRTSLTVANSFSRAQIDLEVGLRKVLRDAFATREAEINQAIAVCQETLQLEKGARQQERQQQQAKLETVRALKRDGLAMLALTLN